MQEVRKTIKPVVWVGSSFKDFRAFPDAVKDEMGYALHQAQTGGKSTSAKPLQGFGGAGVLEVVANEMGDTFRAVYTVKFSTAILCTARFSKEVEKRN